MRFLIPFLLCASTFVACKKESESKQDPAAPREQTDTPAPPSPGFTASQEPSLTLVIDQGPFFAGSHYPISLTLSDERGETKTVDGQCTSSDGGVVTLDSSVAFAALAPGEAVITCLVGDLTAQAAVTIVQAPLTHIAVVDPGAVLVGKTVQLEATGTRGQAVVIIPASWSLENASVGATLSADGRFSASKAGIFTVVAQNGNLTATLAILVKERPLKVSATQFWTFEAEDDQLVFNSPWDDKPGSDVVLDANDAKVPTHAKECAKKALESLDEAFSDAAIVTRLERLKELNATKKVVVLVNAIPDEQYKPLLNDLDRDAYFWHANSMRERPSLAMSRFTAGQWVWEVIAFPKDGCMMPSSDEMVRYLDYATTRLTSKKEGV